MKINVFNIYTDKDITNQKLAIISDIHISYTLEQNKIDDIINTLKIINPNYILIPGNLYNVDLSVLFDFYSNKVAKFINEVSEIAEVYYIKGEKELESNILPWVLQLDNYPKFHSLFSKTNLSENVMHQSNNIVITGINLDKEHYQLDEKKKIELFINKYNYYLNKLYTLIKDQNFNILLCHDPFIINVIDTLNQLQKFDLIITGPNHESYFSNYLKSITKIIKIDKEKLYPKYFKGMIEKENTHFLISQGVTKIHSDMSSIENLGCFQKGSIEVVNILKKTK